jgi:hypothetical protein
MTRSRRYEQGAGRIGCFIWTVLLAAVAVICWKVIPIKMKTSQFYDEMQTQAQFGSIKGDKSIQSELAVKAKELDLPLRKEDIKVYRDASNVHVEVHYEISIDFLGIYTYVWKEDQIVTRPLFVV